MSQLFDLNSPIMSVLASLLDDFILSLLTVLCALPLVTAGPSLCALYGVMTDRIADTSTGALRGFFWHFRRCFRTAVKSWLAVLFLAGFFCLEWQIVGRMAGGMRLFFLVGTMFLMFSALLTCVFLIPLTAADPSLPFLQLWKAAFIQGVGRLPRSLLILLTGTVPILVAIFSLRWFLLLSFVWIFFWPACFSSLWARLTYPLLRPQPTDKEPTD